MLGEQCSYGERYSSNHITFPFEAVAFHLNFIQCTCLLFLLHNIAFNSNPCCKYPTHSKETSERKKTSITGKQSTVAHYTAPISSRVSFWSHQTAFRLHQYPSVKHTCYSIILDAPSPLEMHGTNSLSFQKDCAAQSPSPLHIILSNNLQSSKAKAGHSLRQELKINKSALSLGRSYRVGLWIPTQESLMRHSRSRPTQKIT